MRILISGGWGYGNLGDDAILHATLRLLVKRFPDSEIRILSYDVAATGSELDNRYGIYPSAHRLLFGESAFRQLSIYGKTPYFYHRYPFWGRVRNRIQHELCKIRPTKQLCPDMTRLDMIDNLFAESDMYIMSGGGYFNNWRESFISKVEEIKLALRHGCNTYIVGQTLDDFNPEYKSILANLLRQVTNVSVRDSKSGDMLQSIGIENSVAPDLVLSGLDRNIPECTNDLVIIPAELPVGGRDHFAEVLAGFIKENDLTVRIAMTRLYNADVRDALWLQRKLRRHGISSLFRIPTDFNDIWNDIAGARFIFSRNLHGLILGYLGGGKLLSLNDSWKFQGFMNQIGHSEAICNIGTADKSQMYSVMSQKPEPEVHVQLKQHVEDNFHALFN